MVAGRQDIRAVACRGPHQVGAASDAAAHGQACVFVGSRSFLVQLHGPLRLPCWSSAEDMGWTVTRPLTMRLSGTSTTQGGEHTPAAARDRS